MIHQKKSKTHNAAAATAFFGALVTFLPTVREFIPVDYYGPLFVAIGVGFHYLRSVTTTPVNEK